MQYVKVKFKPSQKRTYTYHNDGPPVSRGDEIKVPGQNGWSKVIVDSVTDERPEFPTKPIYNEEPGDAG